MGYFARFARTRRYDGGGDAREDARGEARGDATGDARGDAGEATDDPSSDSTLTRRGRRRHGVVEGGGGDRSPV